MATKLTNLTFQKGDIIFYRTSTAATFFDLDPGKFDDFRVLSAFGQALPYVVQPGGNQWSPHPQHFRPWHHVSIAVSDTEVVEFVQQGDEDDGINWQSEITKREFVEADKECVDVLRLPDRHNLSYDPEAVARAAEQQVTNGYVYAADGLAAFAVATFGRILPTGLDRDLALNVAYGMNKVVRNRGADEETCVTAAAKAIDSGLAAALSFAEPAAPPTSETQKYFAYQNSPVQRMIGRIQEHTDAAGVIAALEDLKVAGVLAPDFGWHDLPRRSTGGVRSIAAFRNGPSDLDQLLSDHRILPGAQATEVLDALSELAGWDDLGAVGVHYDPDDFSNAGTVKATKDFVPGLQMAFKHVVGAGTTDLVSTGQAARAAKQPDSTNLAVSPAMLFDALWAMGFRREMQSCSFPAAEAGSDVSDD